MALFEILIIHLLLILLKLILISKYTLQWLLVRYVISIYGVFLIKISLFLNISPYALYPSTPHYTSIHLSTPLYTPLYPSTPIYTSPRLSTPLYTPLLPTTPHYTSLHLSTPLYTPLHLSTPLYTPLHPTNLCISNPFLTITHHYTPI